MEISTVYGMLYGCIDPEFYENGILKSTRFDKENNILTKTGLLTPQYTDDNVRRKYSSSVTFYENGRLKSISLEKQAEVLTPLGKLPAELITFYEDGSVKRVFPLNGKISGYWSESDEGELAMPMSFKFDFGEFSAKIMCVYFYSSGRVKSITLFPNEAIVLTTTPIGKIKVRTGFSLYENGRLKSVEPAEPFIADTPIGRLTAYDSGAIGINGDMNSLTFKEDGQIESLKISGEEIIVRSNDTMDIIKPILQQNPLDEDDFITLPFSVKFEDGVVFIEDEAKHSYSMDKTNFTVVKSRFSLKGAACNSCSGCSSCSSCG